MMTLSPGRERILNVMQVVGLLVLVPVGAELLAAYSDNTGDVGKVLFAVVFFACLYGAPALLIREVVRRNGWGWVSLLLLAASLGVLQAGVIDQSLFSVDYGDYEGFQEDAERTWIAPLGVSAFNVQGFVIGHVVFSFAAPLALVEAWRPGRSRVSWFGWKGIVVLVLLYLAAAALIVQDTDASGSGSVTQIGVAAAFAGVLGVAAVLVGKRRRSRSSQIRVPRITLLVLAGLAFGAVQTFVPSTWVGTAIAVLAAVVAAVLALRWSSGSGWTIRDTAALALGVLLARGLAAFIYFPLLGEVSAPSKYTHNAVMLLIVVVAGWAALRPIPGRRAEGSSDLPT